MSAVLAAALSLQAASIALMRYRLGKTWLRRPTVLLIIIAIVYHGVSALLLLIPSVRAWDTYRIGIASQNIDMATLIMSAGVLALAISYLLVAGQRTLVTRDQHGKIPDLRVLDWRPLAIACIPFAILTYHGQGYNSVPAPDSSASVASELASTFFTSLVILAAFAFLLRHGSRWLVPTIIVQSVILAAAGERSPLIAGVAELFILLAQLGRGPSRRQVTGTLVLTLVAVLAITGYRAESGRAVFYGNSGIRARIAALGDGLYSLVNTANSAGTGPGFISRIAVRIDGDSFAGAVWQDMRFGQPQLGVTQAAKSTLIVVPSALWPTKLSHELSLDPAVTEINQFGLQNVNFLPTLPGLYLGFLGPYLLIVFMALCGLIFGCGERWLFRQVTATRLVLLGGSVSAALAYEQGLPGMLVTLRTAVMIGIAVKVLDTVRASGLRRRQATDGAGASRYAAARRRFAGQGSR
jgi:hypothetical protein